MHIEIGKLIVIVALAGVAWYANEKLNRVPVMKEVISVIIVVVAVILALGACGLMGSNASISL